MDAAILAVGNELLGSDRVDTNSLRLTEILSRFGVALATKVVVGDETEMIGEAAGRLMARHRLLLVTGGLGPTQDDLTREAMASVLGRKLCREVRIVDELRRRFAAFGIEMAAVNEKQADVIEGAEVLANRRGTAPGQMVVDGDCTIFLFPGVPAEVDGLAADFLEPWLERNTSGSPIEKRVFKVACVPESTLEQWLQPYYEEWGSDGVALLPSPGEVMIRLSASGSAAERAEWLTPRLGRVRDLLGERIFSDDDSASLESAAGDALAAASFSVATAESCTGGLVAERLTRVAGSSRYFLGSIVSYANSVKADVLGVSPELLAAHGAVSKEVAIAMAERVRLTTGADLAVAVTGIAGPDGGSSEKPVGTVHLALAAGDEEVAMHRRLLLPGDRERVRWVTSQWALETMRRRALGLSFRSGRESGAESSS